MPRPRKITEEQAREIVRRYHLGRQNQASKIAGEYGICHSTLYTYIRQAKKP